LSTDSAVTYLQPPASKALAGYARPTLVYLAALVAAEAFVRIRGPFVGAACYALGFLVLVNVTVLAYRRFDGEGSRWRLAAAAGIPFLDRLLVLSVPPFEWGAFSVSALWGLPLLAAAIAIARPPLVPLSERRLGQPVAAASFRRPGPPMSQILTVRVPITALCVGVVAAVSVPQEAAPIEGSPLIAVAAVVFAFCVQEWLYRLVVQPVAAGVWGDRIGMLTTSALVAFSSVAALSELVPMGPGVVIGAIAVSLLFGLAIARGIPLAAVILGRGLFTICVVLASIVRWTV
jgi:hypothetical protein